MNASKLVFELTMGGGILAAIHPGLAQNWTPTSAPSTNWISVASSADGTKLVAAVTGGAIYSSTNSGETWTATSAPIAIWNTVASSADGTVLVAAVDRFGIWISTNSGSAWTAGATVPNAANDLCAAISADGAKVVASSWAPFVYSNLLTSTNSGVTWTTTNNVPYFMRCASSSADGTKLVVGGDPYRIWISTNSGVTWSMISPPMSPWRLACSADGSKLVASGYEGVFISADSGATWTPTTVGGVSVACSANGTTLIAANRDGIFTSADFGATWFTNDAPNLYWHAVASSADGCKLVAVVNGGGIYTREIMPTPTLTIAPSDNSFLISWVVPSVPFVLQECADLTTTNWTDVTTMPILNSTNLHHEVSVPLSSAYRFYRLKGL